ncbi:MAG: hypothetical protein JWQ11_2339 [Rhizobacter sp.]|nr:hypothetical protein [Rhizobacter sp.]
MQAISQNLGSISLEQIVRFAGAVQDFNPVHYDPVFAKNAGLPGVIAQGPLTYLVALDALMASGLVHESGSFRVRLKAPVFPGMDLALQVAPDGKVSLRAGDAEALSGQLA